MRARLLTGTGLVAPPKFPEKLLNDNREVVRVLEFGKLDRQEGGSKEVRYTDDGEEGPGPEGCREEVLVSTVRVFTGPLARVAA